MEGSRPLLVEVQALVNTTSYGYPKRTASGIDLNRVNLLVAMLERRTKLKLADKDIYVNIVGGIKLTEPAADLAVCMAIASAAKGMQLKKKCRSIWRSWPFWRGSPRAISRKADSRS